MKKKVIALSMLLVMLAGSFAIAGPTVAQASTGKLRAGYATISIDPIDKEGTYRNVDYTSILESKDSTYNSLKKKLASAGVTLENPVYTVPSLQVDCDGNGTKDDGYFSVPLSGYGSTYNRMSTGKADDNGDGKIDSKDGMFAVCIAVTDEAGQTMLFFTMDLIGANNTVFAMARNNIQAALLENYGRIPQSQMMFSASHSHSSPDIDVSNSAPLESSSAQRAYVSMLQDRLVELAELAMADRREVTVSRGSIEATNMNATRHYNVTESKTTTKTYTTTETQLSSTTTSASWVHGDNFGRPLPSDTNIYNSPIKGSSSVTGNIRTDVSTAYKVSNVSKTDDTLHLLQFTPADGGKPIVMVNWRAHPKLNSTSSMQYGKDNRSCTSADYVGMLREKLLKYGYRASFIQGASGNQNTWNYIDDQILKPDATNTYSYFSTYHKPDGTSTAGSYNDRLTFISYTSPTTGKTSNVQTGYSYGARLADYAISCLQGSMKAVKVADMKANQYYFSAEPQLYSEGLKAAVAAYDAATSKSFPFMYLHTDGKYYNLNSSYHANAVRSRSTDASAVDAKLEINCITIGELAFVTAPNELYDRYNTNCDQVNGNLWDNLCDEGYGIPFVLGYTNGSEGYIPNLAAYEYNRTNNDAGAAPMVTTKSYVFGVGAYEANTSKFAPGAGEELCKTFEKMLQQMKELERPRTCPMCGAENVSWQALYSPDATVVPSGHYYLADDLVNYAGFKSYQKTISVGDEVCIDLNGRVIQNGSTVTGRAFYVDSGAVLRLMNGQVHGRGHSTGSNSGGVFYIAGKATLELTNVDVIRDIEEKQSISMGGAIYAGAGSTLKITGGSVTGGAATKSGGNIYANADAGIILKDVTIRGGSAQSGGNLYFTTGVTAELENVLLEEGSATGDGDNIAALSTNVHIYGSSVLKGECYFNNGNNNSAGVLKISGNVQAYQSPTNENIKLATGTKLVFGALESTARIGVTGKTMITDSTGVQYADQIIADSGYLDFSFNYGVFAGELRACECRGQATQKHTCEYHAWTAWTSVNSLPTVGNYYLKNDVTVEKQADVSFEALRLDLCGHTLTRKVTEATATRVFFINNSDLLTITDSGSGGTVKRDLSALTADQKAAITDYGLAVCLTGNTRFRLYAGTLDGQGQQTRGGVVAGTGTENAVEIYGGTICGASAKYLTNSAGKSEGGSGGAVFAQGTLNLYGGTLTGGVAERNGAGLYATGTVTITGDACVTDNYKQDGTTQSNIYCAAANLKFQGAYTGTAGITVSSPAEGKQAALCSNANLMHAKLFVDAAPDYRFYADGTNLHLTLKVMQAFIINGEQTDHYTSLEEAVAAYPGKPAVLHLMTDVPGTMTVSKDMILNLAGCSITGGVSLKNGAVLAVADSNTDDYTVEDGLYGKVPAAEGICAADGYVMVREDQSLSFHKVGMELTAVSLQTTAAGIYYTGTFSGDGMVASNIREYGIALSLSGVPTTQEILADTQCKTHAAYTADWTSGVQVRGVLTQNILKASNSYAVNKYNAGAKIYGVAYVKTDDGIMLGEPVAYSLRNIVETVDDMWQELTAPQKTELVSLFDAYSVFMGNWQVKNLYTAWLNK